MSDDRDDNIRALSQPEVDKMRAAIESFKRHSKYMIEYQEHMAKIQKAAFDARIKEGFTEAQALELVKKI